MLFLSQDWNNCDWGSVALDVAGLAIPGISAASLKIVDKAIDAAKSIKIGGHISGQLSARGWTADLISQTIQNPASTKSVPDTRHLPGGGQLNEPATAYIKSDGSYVVVNNKTGDVVQISDRNDPNWKPPW